MKKFASAAALIGAALTLATPGAALAATGKGTITKFANGKLTVLDRNNGPTVYIVNGQTDCGVSYGQSGDQINCKSLNSAKYSKKPVRITYTRNAANKRVASLVAVDLS
jgi:hypothetical protein